MASPRFQVFFTDNFNRADSDPMDGSWLSIYNGSGTSAPFFALKGSAVHRRESPSQTWGLGYFHGGTWTNNQMTECVAGTTFTGNTIIYLVARCGTATGTANSDAYYWAVGPGTGGANTLTKYISGTATTIGTALNNGTFGNPQPGGTLAFAIEGTKLSLIYNGGTMRTIYDGSIGSGYPGIGFSHSGSARQGAICDDWKGYWSLGTGVDGTEATYGTAGQWKCISDVSQHTTEGNILQTNGGTDYDNIFWCGRASAGQPGMHVDDNAYIGIMESSDGGTTWGAIRSVINGTADDRNTACGMAGGTRLMLFYREFHGTGAPAQFTAGTHLQTLYKWSDDLGTTWLGTVQMDSGTQGLPTAFFSNIGTAASAAIGTKFFAAGYHNSYGTQPYWEGLLLSSDLTGVGTSWTGGSWLYPISGTDLASLKPTEAAYVYVPGTSQFMGGTNLWVGIYRVDNGTYSGMWNYSVDEGTTWTTPVTAGFGSYYVVAPQIRWEPTGNWVYAFMSERREWGGDPSAGSSPESNMVIYRARPYHLLGGSGWTQYSVRRRPIDWGEGGSAQGEWFYGYPAIVEKGDGTTWRVICSDKHQEIYNAVAGCDETFVFITEMAYDPSISNLAAWIHHYKQQGIIGGGNP